MSREEFIKELDRKSYRWREEGERIIVSEEEIHVHLDHVKSIPSNVQFMNRGHVYFRYLKSIGDNVQFRNGGNVNLESLESIPDNIHFNTESSVDLKSMKSIPITSDIDEMFPRCYDLKINTGWLDLERNITFPDSRWNKTN